MSASPYKRLPGTPKPMHVWKVASGISIAGDSWGDPNGPLVLLQHGGGQTRHAWKGAGETLGAAGYYAIAFDARGHGDSGWAPDGNYGQDGMVQDLKSLVEQLGDRRPVLVGASMGGGIVIAREVTRRWFFNLDHAGASLCKAGASVRRRNSLFDGDD